MKFMTLDGSPGAGRSSKRRQGDEWCTPIQFRNLLLCAGTWKCLVNDQVKFYKFQVQRIKRNPDEFYIVTRTPEDFAEGYSVNENITSFLWENKTLLFQSRKEMTKDKNKKELGCFRRNAPEEIQFFF